MKHRVNILLVDDQPARLLSYRAILEPLDQNLVSVNSGMEALRKLMEQDFAVILLDVSMPGMDGFETAATIHQHPRFEKTPIIFVTALHVTDMDRMRGYALGAVDYVYVPVVPEILRSKVSVLVELYTKRRELQELNRSLEQANADLAQANSLLRAEKTRELQELNQTLEHANAELSLTNETLQTHIAERERLEQALRTADRAKDEFLAILAHELRNPLAPIRNGLRLMRLKSMDDTDLCWARDVIDRQVELLVRLVDDLLDISRITQGKINLHREAVDMGDVVARAIETTQLQIDARKQQLSVVLPREPLRVHGDRTRLAQVIGNLLANATKYTDVGGSIQLKVEAVHDDGRGREVVVRVRDTGVGIPPEMLPRLFELFSQVESTVNRAQGGLGIGLALVRRLVEMHGGAVSAHSEGPGRGSEFTVRLPLWLERQQPAASGPRAAPVVSTCGQRRILVVDDNVDSAMTLGMLLQSAGYEVFTAGDGLEALTAAEQHRPDVVLLDLGMPNLDGYGAARRLRAEAWGKQMILIALTGWGQEDVRRRTHEAGFDAHLVKPIEFPTLVELVDRLTQEEPDALAAAQNRRVDPSAKTAGSERVPQVEPSSASEE